MSERSSSKIRNVAVVGHGQSGKTTFVDHLLYAAGAVNRAGSVEQGTSLSDSDPDERERKFSVDSAIFNFQWDTVTFNVIDTPGYLDFTGAALSALPAVEMALMVVSAAEGIQLNTRRLWEAAQEEGVAKAILITKIDSENVRFGEVLNEVQEELSRHCVPVLLPLGTGQQCSGVVDLLEADSAPEGVVGDFDSLKQQLNESIVECDEDLMARYLEGQEISRDQMLETFQGAVMRGEIVPVLCCSAKKDVGVKEALRFLAQVTPSPLDGVRRKATANEEEIELAPDAEGPFCAVVFKSSRDLHVGKLAFFRVYSGRLDGDKPVMNTRTGGTERFAHIYCVFGAEQREVDEAVPGDIICVTRVEEIQFSDTLCAPGSGLRVKPLERPKPMMSLAVEPRSRDDEEKISSGLQRLAESDPTFTIDRDPQSKEMVITGMGGLHLEVMLSKLKRRYDVSVETREPSTPYKETIIKTAAGHHKHKKQTGGHGQYGEVYVRMEPNERGAGFEFMNEITGGRIPSQYVPAVEKGIREVLDKGLLAGYPIVDVKVAVYDGTYHSVDSSEQAFKIAASRAFQDAFDKCKPILLEPIVKVQVTIPPRFMGDVSGNISGHRGRILGMEQLGHMQVVEAELPAAEVTRYSTELKSMTGGEGSFTLEFSHYEPVPAQTQQQIVARKQKKTEE